MHASEEEITIVERRKYSENNCGNKENGAGKIVCMLVIEITDGIIERTECKNKTKEERRGKECKTQKGNEV